MSFDLSTELDKRGISRSALARAVGVNKSAVTRWAKWGIPIPEERVSDVAAFIGVPPEKLRPAKSGASA